MGKLYEQLNLIKENQKNDYNFYAKILEALVDILIYKNTYLAEKRENANLKYSRENIFIDCGGFGIIK